MVLAYMGNEANDEGLACFPSVERIAQKCRISRNTVLAVIGRLEEAGELAVVRPETRGRGRFNRYALVLGRDPEAVREALRKGATSVPFPDPEKARSGPKNGAIGPQEWRDQTAPDPKDVDPTTDPTPSGPSALFAAPDAVEQIFDTWRTSAGRNGTTALSPERRRIIQRALKDYPATDVTDAVRGWEHSAFHRGNNERRKPYNDLGLLLRDAEHIERFRDLARGPREPDPAPRTREHVQTDRSVKTGRIQAP